MSHDASGVAFYEYVGHHSLIDLTILDDETEGDEEDLAASTGVPSSQRLTLKITPSAAQEAERDEFAEFAQDDRIQFLFDAEHKLLKLMWETELHDRIRDAKQPSNKMERFEGAVIFADVSGFSDLGDFLERRERETAQRQGAGLARTKTGESAAEGLARFLGHEIEKMVALVTKGGGDVIKFAGDCVIAVFQAEDYVELEKDLDYHYSALALATGQAIRVSSEMVNRQRDVVARAGERDFGDDEVSELVAKLNIHVAIGAGMVYGYHVGGVGRKWEYLIDGPVMGQVRLADADAGAGQVALSKEAHELVKRIEMMKTRVPSGNYLISNYLGPTTVPRFVRPWETVQGEKMQDLLANLLMQYVATPVVEQVQAGLTTVAQHRTISTAFCRLIGIDYESQQGEIAVMELGAITSQVQLILERHQGTLTRVISDDKGTSMLIAFEEAPQAVLAALEMVKSITSIPVQDDQEPFKTAIGITTGTVWIGCVGGRIRSEYTMHGSHVNFAARLMTCPLIKTVGGILCDRVTRDLAPEIAFTESTPQKFKGFVEKQVAYMPHLPGEDPADLRPLDEQLAERLIAHNQEVRVWEEELMRVLGRKSPRSGTLLQRGRQQGKGRGALVVVETDCAGHWNLDALFEAIDRSNEDAQLERMDRYHIPLIAALASETELPGEDDDRVEQRRKETVARHKRNEQALVELLADPSALRSTVCVIERANALSPQGWGYLNKLCVSKKYLRQDAVHSVIVVTLEPIGDVATEAAQSGEAALAAAGGGKHRWSTIRKSTTYRKIPWFSTSGAPAIPEAGPSMDEGTVETAALPPPAIPPTPTKPGQLVHVSSKLPRTRSVAAVGADRIFTLKVCAVLASESAEETDEPRFAESLLAQLHPNVLNGTWVMEEDDSGKNCVAEHVSFFVGTEDPETEQPYLARMEGAQGATIRFPSVAAQQARYHQMIFEDRAKVHKNMAVFLKCAPAPRHKPNQTDARGCWRQAAGQTNDGIGGRAPDASVQEHRLPLPRRGDGGGRQGVGRRRADAGRGRALRPSPAG